MDFTYMDPAALMVQVFFLVGLHMAAETAKLAIVGDFNPDFLPHPKTNDAIAHANASLSEAVFAEWIPSTSLASNAEAQLAGYDGIWVAPGSPYRSMEGALAAIQFSRRG
jgi:CTP synthase (UTP-ammonia lyase)